jgi:hypothetical protein
MDRSAQRYWVDGFRRACSAAVVKETAVPNRFFPNLPRSNPFVKAITVLHCVLIDCLQ